MSWLFAGNKEFDEIVDQATSEMLPNAQEDMALNLEITDKIRSKSVPPKEAMRALKRRLTHRNPNVQLLTLKLADVCVKNGGGHFLAEIASREFMDCLVGLINGTSTANEVRQKALQLIQLWANAFKGKEELRYVNDTFASLRASGVSFPPASSSDTHGYSSFMLDTTAAPDWSDSDTCERCRELFTLTKRKHHCRNCGKTFCNSCSSRSMKLPKLGINEEVRVCENCYLKAHGNSNNGSDQALNSPVNTSGTPSNARREIDAARKEEEELQRAIALSMLEAEKKGYGTTTTASSSGKSDGYYQQQKSVASPSGGGGATSEEEDPELAAAIAASLKEVSLRSGGSKQQQQSTKSESMYPSEQGGAYPSASSQYSSYVPPARQAVDKPSSSSSSSYGDGAQYQQVPQQQKSSSFISDAEKKNIDLFSQLMEKIDNNGDVNFRVQQAQDPALKTMYDSMISMHPKIVKEIEECVEKHKSLMALHEKITVGVRAFDRVLEDQRSYAQQQQQQQQQQLQYGRPQVVGGYPQPAPTQYYGQSGAAPGAQYQSQQQPQGGYYQQSQQVSSPGAQSGHPHAQSQYNYGSPAGQYVQPQQPQLYGQPQQQQQQQAYGIQRPDSSQSQSNSVTSPQQQQQLQQKQPEPNLIDF
ncbi:hypothetical protein MP228_011817 [Amoeboaphelidium protococcarum]|nr:hypothetical protein MP228_011817 [Amoeboaphelidium protococcarum]